MAKEFCHNLPRNFLYLVLAGHRTTKNAITLAGRRRNSNVSRIEEDNRTKWTTRYKKFYSVRLYGKLEGTYAALRHSFFKISANPALGK